MVGVTYSILTGSGKRGDGDTVIAECPAPIREYLESWGGAVVVGGPITGWLTELGKLGASFVNRQLHSAEFIFTSDPDEVREFGIMDEHRDCVDCREGVETALRALEKDPDLVLVVGQLHWTQSK